jgi:hypothetical protein
MAPIEGFPCMLHEIFSTQWANLFNYSCLNRNQSVMERVWLAVYGEIDMIILVFPEDLPPAVDWHIFLCQPGPFGGVISSSRKR